MLSQVLQKKRIFAAVMELAELIQHYSKDSRVAGMVSEWQKNPQARVRLTGMSGSLSAFIAAGLWRTSPNSCVFVLNDRDAAAYFHNDLKCLLYPKDVLFFPDSFKKSGEIGEINKNNVLMRAETVARLLASHATGELVVTYPEALFEKVVQTKALQRNTIFLKIGERIDTPFVMEMLTTYGFEKTDFVYEPGQFSVRGGILDIFSFGNELPYRVELFGNEVDSIRTFDPFTQLSVTRVLQVRIVPNIQTQFVSSEKTTLFKIMPTDTTIWVKDMSDLLAINQKCYEKALIGATHLQQTSTLPDEEIAFAKDAATFVPSAELLRDMLDYRLVEFGNKAYFSDTPTFAYHSSPQPPFRKNFELLIADLKKNTKAGIKNILWTGSERQTQRLAAIFADLQAKIEYKTLEQTIHEGFIDHDAQIASYTDHQIFDRYHKFQIKQGFSKDKALTLKFLLELQPGDYVTHIDHGVGIYGGLEKISINGRSEEAMRILYKDNDVVRVSINSLHKVSKYAGREGTPPKLNKLGSDAWEAVKRKAKRQIKDIAADLIRLYAQRKAAKGFAFAPDTYLQTELEASFIYEDTPDQLKATQDVKKDMEAECPMDRLVCGDVGFGKTEVAVRAAAKAVADSKQVAILVPTTILALQHFETFSERLKDFPATIQYINRFKTVKEKRVILEQLAEGKIDIIIGTHALLSKTVQFKDLGLLVVDEEQKFGVAAKEKLRQIRINVDTLTLTATPIPRTLQFSLMNARDLSVINTPPPNRQPVQTELISNDEEKIKDAINFEVYRGGQAFYVHNRVKDLYEIANMIKRLCPDIDVGVAHGQMSNDDLEDHITRFMRGKYDVLVCTNIIETGLDVSNANTIIISNAHQFGLSDLHQLRGRVGRSNRKAFCYLISPPIVSLPDDSRKRLKTIEQFSELGSGFQVAMRDLDIRGAGDILGAEQSGFLTDIGFDTYQKILNEAIQELKTTEFKEVFQDEVIEKAMYVPDCQVDTDVEMLIPDLYVGNISERLSLYTRLDNIIAEEELEKFHQELQDRFGKIPREVRELFNAVRLRWAAKRLGFERIILKNRKLRCYFVESQQSSYYQSQVFANVMNYIQKFPKKNFLKQTERHLILLVEEVKSLGEARVILEHMEQL